MFMFMLFFFWNCQGAASREFNRTLKNFIQVYSICFLLCLLSRISNVLVRISPLPIWRADSCLSSSAPTELSGRHQLIILLEIPPSNAIPTRPENPRADGMSFYPSRLLDWNGNPTLCEQGSKQYNPSFYQSIKNIYPKDFFITTT